MPTAANAKIDYEAAQVEVPYAAMTDSGDHKIFNFADDFISDRSGYSPTIRPNGIVTGINLITPAVSTTNDYVDCAAFTAYFAGVLVSVSADTDLVCVRATPTDTHIINSIVCDSTGTLSVVTGTGATSFSTTRGAAGGPPSIPLASIEVGQVRFTSNSAAVVTTADIFQSVESGQVERYDYPMWDRPNTIGEGNIADVPAKQTAYVDLAFALPLIHGATPTAAATAYKPVYTHYYTPVFVTISESVDFVPAEESTSVSSTQIYRKSIASSSDSLGAGSFTAYLNDGISDNLTKLKGENLIFRFYPDENKAPYSITQGILSFTTSYPATEQIMGSATIAARLATANFDS